MKDRRYANRGQAFEEFIRYANAQYARRGIALVEKVPTEFIPLRDRTGHICNVKVENKSKVDFLGRYKAYPLAMEAKHTSGELIRFDEVQPHQAQYLTGFVSEPGTIGIVLVSFSLRRFFAVPWHFWSAAYDLRVTKGEKKTPCTVTGFGQRWTIPQKFSVRAEELHPEWEITGTGNVYGLDYLRGIERYATPEKQPENHQEGI